MDLYRDKPKLLRTATGLARPLLALALLLGTGGKAFADDPHQHMHSGSGEAAARAPMFDNLGSYHRGISTKSPEAQRYFDQGLRLFYAFNLEEAQRSFEEAARLDPGCAACDWGVALSLGPHINLPAMADRTKAAYAAVLKAQANLAGASPVERALIEASAKRYSDPPPATPEGQKALDTAYADAMRDVMRRFPDDLDAAALFAESMMDLRPWDLWTLDGKPQPGTDEIVATLESILKRNPNHPGANHYYIHAVEASTHPEKALASAQRMPGLVPGAAHLVHMPSHVYARVGRYADAAEANRKAIQVDKQYIDAAKPQGFYMMYVAHNFQFLWHTALMQGRSAEALQAARGVLERAPMEMLRQMPGFDFVLAYPIWTHVRFGHWQEALGEPAPPAEFRYATAVWHVARGLALTGLGRLDEAGFEQDSVTAIAKALPADALVALNSAHACLDVASNLLAGQLAAKRGQTDEAVRRLQTAMQAEDNLKYDEPPDWYFAVRPSLGRLLLEAGRAAEAQAVFEEDLRRNPNNGWSLFGLAESLKAEQKSEDAAKARQRFEAAWKQADVSLKVASL